MKKKEQKHARVDFSSDEGDEQNDALDIAVSEAAEYNGDTVMLPEDYAENEEVKQILADTINSLNSDQRDAVYLFYYKNNSISEIAEQAGVSENTIKSRLSLARKYMERKLKKLQKNGVVLCAVPIPVILNIVVSESKLKAAAPVVTTTAGGATSGAAVSAVSGKIGALIAAGIMIGGGVGIYSTLSDRSGNIHKGDIRTADSSSVRISDASSIDSRNDWDPDLIKVVDTDTVESTIAVDDASSQTDSRPTNTNQGNTRTVQQAQPAQPAQQVITYYDDVGQVDGDNYEADENNEGNDENDDTEDTQQVDPNSLHFSYRQTDDGYEIYEYKYTDMYDNVPEITIPAEIDGHRINAISYNTELNIGNSFDTGVLKKITISNGIEHIGAYAFSYCDNLESIILPESLKNIERDAFYACSSLKDITLPNGITSIDWYAFQNCTSLKSITIPDSVTDLSIGAFRGCSQLETVNLSSNITRIDEETFMECKNLKTINIPDGVTSIGNYAFAYCNGLTNVTIPDSVKSIGQNAFQECTSLKSITIPNSVTKFGNYPFADCASDLIIKCYKDSDAHKYAIANGINVELLD